MIKNVLIIGSEGYIGTIVSKYFLKKKYKVYGIDNYTYGKFQSKIDSKNFVFNRLNVKNINFIKKLINKEKIENIVILSGLVGDPITKKYPKLAKKTNEDYIIKLIDACYSVEYIKKLIFVSTCSNYGIAKNIPNENSDLKPLSLYAKSKVKIEKYLMSKKTNKKSYCILRFATAFGLSERMRFDLTLNEFVLNLFKKKELLVYDKDTWRPYCHIKDFASVIYKIIVSSNNLIHNEIFNVGSNKNNATKQMLVNKISKYLSTNKVKYLTNSFDKRNYRVNFNKIKKKLKIKMNYGIDYGIKEIINYLRHNKNIAHKQMGNYKILND